MTRITPWSFKQDDLFGAYRTTLENVANVMGPEPVEDTNGPLTLAKPQTGEEDEAVLYELRVDQYEKEYKLITKLESDGERPLNFDYTLEDIESVARAKCAWLFGHDIRAGEMCESSRLLKQYFLLALICQDKHSAKITDLLDRFHEIFITNSGGTTGKTVRSNGLANIRHVEHLHHLIEKTHSTAQRPEKDEFYEKCTAQKKRGRTSQAERLKQPDVINRLRKEYITPKKATNPSSARERASLFQDLCLPMGEEGDEEGAEEDADMEEEDDDVQIVNGRSQDTEENEHAIVLTDKYVLFCQILRLLHHTAPSVANYGSYLTNMYRLIRLADEDETIHWPMHELCKSILNMEACIEIRLIESLALEGETYHCSYSGERLQEGDSVYLIRILEYDAARHRKWRINKAKPVGRLFEEPALLKDVSVYMVQRNRVSPAGLFPIDFTPQYKERHAAYFSGAQQTVVLRTHTTTCKVWCYVDRMRRLIYEHGLEHESGGKIGAFHTETQRLSEAFEGLATGRESFRAMLQRILEPYCEGVVEGGEEERTEFINMMVYFLVDFVSLFFSWPEEKDRPRKAFTQEEIQSLPRGGEVRACEGLRQLLNLVIKRRRMTNDEHPNQFLSAERDSEGEVLGIEPFARSSVLFLAVFDYLFPLKENPRALVNNVLQLLGILRGTPSAM